MRKTGKLPSNAARAARVLLDRPGVQGVFWGFRRTRGEWRGEPALAVHVHRKWDAPATEAIPSELYGVPTDVLAVGSVRYHSIIDTADRVRSSSRPSGVFSAISALAADDDGRIIALLSGHGTLRIAGTSYESGPWQRDRAPWVRLVDDHTTNHHIELTDGSVTPSLDFSLGWMPRITSDDVLLGHTLCSLPIRVRRDPVQPGERVLQWSPERGRALAGQVVQRPVSSALNDGVGIEVEGAIVVIPAAGESAFSVPGDSGSLVFDVERRAIGFVVAGSEDESVSYILPFHRELETRLGRIFTNFFEVAT